MQDALGDQIYWDEIWRFTGEPRTAPPRIAVGHDRSLPRARLRRRTCRRAARFLELGAGGSPWPGHVARTLDADAWGIDCLARRAWQRAALAAADVRTRVTLIEGDVFDGSLLPCHAFDVVYSGGFLEHFPSPRGVLARVAELVAPERRRGDGGAQPARRQRRACRRSPIATPSRATSCTRPSRSTPRTPRPASSPSSARAISTSSTSAA